MLPRTSDFATYYHSKQRNLNDLVHKFVAIDTDPTINFQIVATQQSNTKPLVLRVVILHSQLTFALSSNMAPFSNLEHAETCYYDDDDSLVSLESSSSSICVAPQRKSSLHGDRSSQRASCSVSFATEAAVYVVLHIHDYSLAERRDAWYSAEEMRKVRLEWKGIVQRMEYDEEMMRYCDEDEDDSLCVRGLEGKTTVGKRRRREARSASLEVVLDEQIFQGMDSSMMDPVMIAMAYHEHTFPLQLEAYEQAQRDAQAVGCAIQEDLQPKKFDFRTVRAEYLSQHHHCYTGEDAAVATTLMADALDVHSSNNMLLEGPSLRKRFSSCFLPLTPKRYARRTRPIGSLLTKGADV
jgi:hypothetical protein